MSERRSLFREKVEDDWPKATVNHQRLEVYAENNPPVVPVHATSPSDPFHRFSLMSELLTELHSPL